MVLNSSTLVKIQKGTAGLRRRRWLRCWPCGPRGRQPGLGSANQATASTSCPWVTSQAPIAQRVAQLMGQMSLADKITMVEGHGTSNPYVFYTPAIPALCIPAVDWKTVRPESPTG